ncbi:hypothetical protein QTP86_015664 [Hemibagrus guttatus]|nr:hypothetical protein QTP86_015664 [Hemibagrus guttatus]
MDDLEKSYMGTGYLGKVRKFCAMKRRQLNWYSLQHDEHRDTEKRELNSRLVLVDQLVQRYKGGTEEEINQVEWKINQLEQLYMYTQYYKQVKVLCDVKRKQLGRGGPQHVAMTADTLLKKKMNDVEQCVHEAIEGGKEKMSEAEEKIYQLELHMTSEDVVEVSKFCMYMRAELFWSTLHSDKDQLMTDNIEILWKVEEVMNSLQKIRDEVKREQEILNSTEVDKMKKDLTEIVKWCEEKRRG